MNGDRVMTRTCWTAVAAACVLPCLGCSVVGRVFDAIPHQRARSSLRFVQPIEAEQFSTTEPVTVEAAAPGIADAVRAEREAPEKLEVALADVRVAALANNLDLQVELLDPAIAQQNVPIEEGRFDALLGVAANRIHLDTPSVPPSGFPVTGSQFDSHNVDLQVTLPSRTGGSLQIARPLLEERPEGSPALFDSDLRFSISQPLLRNAGIQINNAPIRIAKYTTLQVDALNRLQVITVLASAERQYWLLWAARKELDIRQQQYDLATRQMADVKRFVAAEAKPGFEVIRAEAGIAQRVETIIVAQANLTIAERELKRIMNRPDIPIESRTTIETASDPELLGLELDELMLADMALRNRPELTLQRFQLEIDNINIDVARNSRWPLATLDATTNVNGVGRSWNQSHDVLDDGDFVDYTVGLNVTMPIPNQTARALDRRARLRRSQTLATGEQLSQQIRQEVYNAVTLFEQNWQRILAARNNVRFATLDLDVERKLFDAGEQNRTTTEVLNAAGRLADAQSAEVRAIAAYQISRVDVAFATGTLLGLGRIRWDVNPACRYVTDATTTARPAAAEQPAPSALRQPESLDPPEELPPPQS